MLAGRRMGGTSIAETSAKHDTSKWRQTTKNLSEIEENDNES